MWKNKVILWEETDHEWSSFGTESLEPELQIDPLYAKGLFVWKEVTLGEFVEKGIEAIEATNECFEDINIATGFFLAVATINLFPVHIKIVKEDKYADKFLSLLKIDEQGKQFFIKKELLAHQDLDTLVKYFIENNLISEEGEKLFIKGKVLNRAHIKRM